MSDRDYRSNDERSADAAERSADALERLADTLDDYMNMSLSAQRTMLQMQALEPAVGAVLQPLIDVIAEIKERRAAR